MNEVSMENAMLIIFPSSAFFKDRYNEKLMNYNVREEVERITKNG